MSDWASWIMLSAAFCCSHGPAAAKRVVNNCSVPFNGFSTPKRVVNAVTDKGLHFKPPPAAN